MPQTVTDPTLPAVRDDALAAVFRFEGVLSPRPTLTAAAWMALNARRVRARLLGMGSLALAAPLSRQDPGRAARLAWSCLEGMSEDRLIVLGQIYAEEHLLPALSEVGLEMLQRCRDNGQRVVWISDNLDVIVRPVADALGVDDLLANAMELDADGHATGALRAPVIGRELGGRGLIDRLAERGIALRRGAGYGASGADAVLLGAVALPCAVTPDRALRRVARDLDWPIVERAESR